ncbi:zinc finger protein ZAT11-like [Neltuma alba]|uniref:zinc finger protein ZAT11-like n=1 Tax=Neltuma alba TaxID=207710 RepID=UPI0010A3A773|nr:zinc finger protein ZAT11-like [Prosopis alba]
MKRERDCETSLDLANCLMLLSHRSHQQTKTDSLEFECKTCRRKFSSFQALGGHRASHKRPKLDGEDDLKAEAKSLKLGNRPKMHECSVCGMEFSLGQALGGHMRKHRAALHPDTNQVDHVLAKVPVLKRSNSKRVFCLDLNLTPLQNDLNLLFGKTAPAFT